MLKTWQASIYVSLVMYDTAHSTDWYSILYSVDYRDTRPKCLSLLVVSFVTSPFHVDS